MYACMYMYKYAYVYEYIYIYVYIGVTLNDAANLAARTCTFTDNIYGAFYLEDEASIEGSRYSVYLLY